MKSLPRATITRRTLLAVMALAAGSTTAHAQAWPQRPITIIVSQAAGASPDVMARLMADAMSKSLGQGVVIENKPGGGNVIGAAAAARAAPDGYTLFFATSAALVTNPYMMKNLSYDPLKDYVPISLVTRSNQLIVVHPDLPVKTLPELIARDKAEPGKLSVAVDSPRALAGVTAQALNKTAGLKLVLVPYPNINAGIQDTLAGRVQVGVFSISVVASLIKEGKLRAIATASAKRTSEFPQLPAAAEALPGFDYSGWFMLMAPAGTPADIVKRVQAETAKAVGDQKVKEMAPKLGFELDGGSAEAAGAFLKEQLALWGKITKDLGIEPQ